MNSTIMDVVRTSAMGQVRSLFLVLLMTAIVCNTAIADQTPSTENNQRSEPVQFLFIHHSCGGLLLADPGTQVGGERDSGARCIYVSHPNGGGLRSALEMAGYAVNETSYGSQIGEDTDIWHWHQKFTNQMDDILVAKRQDEKHPEGVTNQIVAFKSCYPNNRFIGMGAEIGDPDSSDLTVSNAQAAYQSLLPLFRDHPEVLFIAFTAPPLAEEKPVGFKAKLKRLFKGAPKHPDLARLFNTWLVDREQGWLADYNLQNVVVFDYYDILTKHGQTNWSAYPTRDGRDSHPSSEGNQLTTAEFLPFLANAWEKYQKIVSP